MIIFSKCSVSQISCLETSLLLPLRRDWMSRPSNSHGPTIAHLTASVSSLQKFVFKDSTLYRSQRFIDFFYVKICKVINISNPLQLRDWEQLNRPNLVSTTKFLVCPHISIRTSTSIKKRRMSGSIKSQVIQVTHIAVEICKLTFPLPTCSTTF